MNFDLTDERQMLQDSLRRFLRDKYDTETRNRILESETGYSTEIWEGLAELGVIGALFTEEQGGFGGAGFDLAVVFEELGRAGVVEPLLDSAVLAGGLIADLGTEEQQEHIEQLIGGALQLAFAHGEPGSRYDLEDPLRESMNVAALRKNSQIRHDFMRLVLAEQLLEQCE